MSERHVVATTIAVLMIVVPLVVAGALVATGNATDLGGLVLLAMIGAGGVYVLIDARRGAGTPEGRVPPRRRLVAVGATLALLVVGALAIAVVMSVVGDGLRGRPVVAEVVVGLVVTVVVALAALAVRRR